MKKQELRVHAPGNPAVHRIEGAAMATKPGKSNTNTGAQETADRTRVVETVVRASGMQRQQVENVLSFMEQQGFRVVAGPGDASAQGERSDEEGQQEK